MDNASPKISNREISFLILSIVHTLRQYHMLAIKSIRAFSTAKTYPVLVNPMLTVIHISVIPLDLVCRIKSIRRH